MKILTDQNSKTSIYILTETHIQKLDELISELQCVYCDIYSNRQLSLTSGLEKTPLSGLLNAIPKNRHSNDDLF